MRIVYCIAGTYRGGGMERVLALKANALAARGHEVTILTSDQRGREPFFELDPHVHCEDLGIGYEDNNGGSFLNKLLHYPAKRRLHRRRLKEALERIDPDIAVSMFCGEASILPGLHRRSRKVAEVHFSRFKRLQYGRRGLFGLADRLLTRADGRTARRYDRFVVLTAEDSANWGAMKNLRVIGNPLTFEPKATAPLENKRALAIGRLTAQKGFDRLIDAWATVASHYPDWRLTIAGEGELRGELEVQIERLGLAGSVEIVPPTKDVEKLYTGASMYVMTSRYEGLPMVLIEAQSCGLPIVSMACQCGPRDVVTDGTDGLLVADGDTAGMARAMERLIADGALRKKMGANALKAAQRFAPKAIIDQWENMFNELKDER